MAGRMLNKLRHFMGIIGVNKAVLFGVLSKVWAAFGGLIMIAIVATHFSQQLQGYYFTFSSLLALQVIVELGLATVIINFASHEWSHLKLDMHGKIIGDVAAKSRLRSLAGMVFRWYMAGAIILSIILFFVGYNFFSRSEYTSISWTAPWLLLSLVSAFNLFLVPVLSLLEGSNQVAQVYFVRFIQEIFRSFSAWTVIVLGGGLWALGFSIFCMAFWTAAYVLYKYHNYFISLFQHKIGPRISWRKEIWPMQWRIAISYLSSYFYFPLFIPVLFHYKGAVVAGQAGITLAMTSTILSIASMWIITRAPQFGMLTSKKEYKTLDKEIFRSGLMALGISGFGATAVFLAVLFVNSINHPIALRILPPLPTAFFLATAVLMQIFIVQSTSLRAHKKDPYVGLSVMSALMMFILTIITGSRWGALGIAISYFSIFTFFGLPYATIIWFRCRKLWRHESYFEPEIIPGGNIIT